MYHGSSSSVYGPPLIEVTGSGSSSSSSSPTALTNFGAHVRDHYRAYFSSALAADHLRPLVIPYSVLGAFIIPVLYLAIPHTRRPWLYKARYLVMLGIVAFNMAETFGYGAGRRRSSSANFAVGYAVGLMQAWGVLWSATLLLWMRPQFDAERVAKRRRDKSRREVENGGVKGNGLVEGNGAHREGWHGNRVAAQRVPGNGALESSQLSQKTMTLQNGDSRCEDMDPVNAPDEDIARSLVEGYEYYWQAYPADESFATRLAWSLDLVMSFRGTGKFFFFFFWLCSLVSINFCLFGNTKLTLTCPQAGIGAFLLSHTFPNPKSLNPTVSSTSLRFLAARAKVIAATPPSTNGLAADSCPWPSCTSLSTR